MDSPNIATIKVSKHINDKASDVLADFGMSTRTAVNHFLESIIETRTVPAGIVAKQKIIDDGVDRLVELIPIGKPIETKEELWEWLKDA
ncbi:hypothetical protein NFX39_04530 [Fructobacillus sp. W13]|uniref:DNA-damage-inducible protein J n=1 Tax=Fructobacillus apis TaxID=2935017 RepID=A0ABT0ZQV2_9LACO|nr:hypothetical protein [Fructobacillus apis]MCO0832357.1 hypothetical protein [Fructobacillus apis]